ncbi:MAG: CPBP family intramembrane metalloprotease [Clostridiales bacterium]|jgi:membrane protease YdiL (CAAX protease family)|nr:CPBP family intramembrane metalloprotease [Clostridiales bacterium]
MENEKKIPTLRRVYNASFIAYFCILVGAALLRLIIYWGAFASLSDDAVDYVFTFITQILLLGAGPVLLIGLYFKKGAKGTLHYLQVKKPKGYFFFAFLIGFVGFFATYFIALVWNIILSSFGYNQSGSAFSIYTFGQFALAALFIGVFPAVCEEITHRGLLLRAQKSAGLSDRSLIVMNALLFGLFHMYIGQTFYTAILGGVMAFVTVKSKSILPAMFIHFTNNFMNVYAEFAYLNGLPGQGFYAALQNAAENLGPAILLILFCLLCVPALFALCYAFLRLARRAGDAPPPKPRVRPIYYGPYNPYAFYNQYQNPNAPYGNNPNQNPNAPYADPNAPQNPYAPRNPYGQPQPFNPYAPQQQQNPLAPQPFNPYAPQNPVDAPFRPEGNADPAAPFPEYEKPAQPFNPYAPSAAQNNTAPPQNPTPAAPPQNPYGQPQPFNPYAPQQQQNPYAPPAAQNIYAPPPQTAWEPLENPDKLQTPETQTFKPKAADQIFQYAAIIFAGLITIVSLIIRL